jgi:hypothetical protein
MHDRSTSRPGDRRRRLSRLASLGLLPTVGVLDAGCGNDPGGATSSVADRNNEARDAQLKDARCMRDHGVDMPDPTFEGDGRSTQTGPDLKDLKRPKFREAEQACKKHLEGIEPPNLSEEEQQEFEDAAPANALCARARDREPPRSDVRRERRGPDQARPGSGGLDPEDPDFQRAQKACENTMPQRPSEESAP